MSKKNTLILFLLSDFGGGGPLAVPNDIDFGAAFSGFSHLDDNPTVFSVCVCLVLVFCALLVWARRKDKLMEVKVGLGLTLPTVIVGLARE